MQTQTSPAARTRKLYLPTAVVHRDGQRTAFEIRRIADAVDVAGRASGVFDEDEACRLTQRILAILRQRFGVSEPTTEAVREVIDSVLSERTLSHAGGAVAGN